MQAKFDVDEKVNITGKVIEINTTDEGTFYQLKVKTMNGSVMLNIEEDELEKKSVDLEPNEESDGNSGDMNTEE